MGQKISALGAFRLFVSIVFRKKYSREKTCVVRAFVIEGAVHVLVRF